MRWRLVSITTAAGGSYAFAYTDEQGHTTTFSMPAIARLALLAPAPGAVVPIPRPVAPVPTPSAIPAPRTPDLAHVPLTVRYAVPSSLPPSSVATVAMEAECATSRAHDGCGIVGGRAAEPATGTYAISDASYAYSYGFETFVPGPGYIGASFQVVWWPAATFQQVKVTYGSYTESPVTWTASAD